MANNCMCNEVRVLIFPCSGGSDVGELSKNLDNIELWYILIFES